MNVIVMGYYNSLEYARNTCISHELRTLLVADTETRFGGIWHGDEESERMLMHKIDYCMC